MARRSDIDRLWRLVNERARHRRRDDQADLAAFLAGLSSEEFAYVSSGAVQGEPPPAVDRDRAQKRAPRNSSELEQLVAWLTESEPEEMASIQAEARLAAARMHELGYRGA